MTILNGNKKYFISSGRTVLFVNLMIIISIMFSFPAISAGASTNAETIIVSAEGLADPNADIYKRDKGIMVDDLRRDAKRQAIEKAVGAFVDSSTLVENYMLVSDKILTKSQGLIKRIIKETSPTLGGDGLMHMFIKAEVFLADVKSAIKSMSKENRLDMIKEQGNPTISVAIVVKDAKRGSKTAPMSSTIAENILKEHFINFGYRVWSENYTKILQKEIISKGSGRRIADFSVIGEAKFKNLSLSSRGSAASILNFPNSTT